MNTKSVVLAGLAMIVVLNVALMGLYLLVRPLAPTQAAPADTLPVLKSLPPFTLTSEKDTPFHAKDLLGQVWVADFIFTSCGGPCPIMTRNMAGVAETLAQYPDVAFVSISVDPETDSPEVLAKYSEHHGADPERWNFLTGDLEAIQSIAVEGFMVGSVEDPIIHSTKFCLVDKEGRLRGHYDGTDEAELDELIAAIHQLREE